MGLKLKKILIVDECWNDYLYWAGSGIMSQDPEDYFPLVKESFDELMEAYGT